LTRQIIKARVAAGLPDFSLLRGSHLDFLTLTVGRRLKSVEAAVSQPQLSPLPGDTPAVSDSHCAIAPGCDLMPAVKFTRYFEAVRQRPDCATIRLEWIERVIANPVREVIQQDGRIRRWAPIAEMDGRYLRVNTAVRRCDGVQRFLRPLVSAMKIRYFQDTDSLYIEFRPAKVSETRDLDENTLLDLDPEGNICGITIEHARNRADIPHFSFEQVVA
jgi:uncharacterized protein YuzE